MTATANHAQLVLALDAMLASGWQPSAEDLARLPAFALALADQIDATVRDVGSSTRKVAQRLDTMIYDEGLAGRLPDWLRLGVLDALAGFLDGTARTCTHSPSMLRPEPLGAAAYHPGLIVCGRCPHLLRLPHGSVRDRTCDACGHVCDLAAGDGIHPSTVTAGVLTYAFGVCADCFADLPTREDR